MQVVHMPQGQVLTHLRIDIQRVERLLLQVKVSVAFLKCESRVKIV